jgi:hypothetical protein
VTSAQLALQSAQAAQATLRAGPTASDLAAAQAGLASAQAALAAKVAPPSDADVAD